MPNWGGKTRGQPSVKFNRVEPVNGRTGGPFIPPEPAPLTILVNPQNVMNERRQRHRAGGEGAAAEENVKYWKEGNISVEQVVGERT